MRRLLLSALFLTAVMGVSGQTATGTTQSLPDDPQKLLAAAEPFYDFNSPELKPWHLKATYQLYDDKGKPSEQGTYEYWWASPQVYRSTWTRAQLTRTDWMAGGSLHRKESGSSFRYFERMLGTVLLSPLPPRGVLDSGRIKLGLKMVAFGHVNLTCVSSVLPWKQDGKIQAPSSSAATYYCFSPATLALRITNSNSITTEYSGIARFQGHYLARQVEVSIGMQRVFSISVGAIDEVDASDPVFIPAADAVIEGPLVTQPSTSTAGEQVAVGVLIKKTPPVYPIIAKMAHEQGVVIIGAEIGTDGKVHNPEVLASPFPLLADSAVDAVKRWEYKPYLLNGVAVEVETVINVVYSLGR